MAIPEEEDPAPDSGAGAEPEPPVKHDRPGWLVGAEEGLEAEHNTLEAGQELIKPKLSRPDGGAPPGSVEAGPRDDKGGAAPLKLVQPGDAPVARPPRSRLPDLDDPRLSMRGWTPRLEVTGSDTFHPISPTRDADPAGQGPEPDFDGPESGLALVPDRPARDEFPHDDFPPPTRGRERDPVEDLPLPPTREPILNVVMPILARVWPWIAGAAALWLLVTWLIQAIGVGTVRLSSILRHPDRYDSQVVRVRGRVGDVFPVGGGYTFYLLQGRDTLVVFTRSRVPVSRQNLELEGQVSIGFLGGESRPALLESIAPTEK